MISTLAFIGVAIMPFTAATPIPTLVQHPIASSAAPIYLDGSDWTVYRFGNGTGPAGPTIPATVPGDIITDLQRAGKVPDPYWNTSWREPSFIAAWNTGSWQYRKTFPTPDAPADGGEVLLTFDGVFMGATLELNGERLTTTTEPLLGNVTGAADQFLRYTFPVARLLHAAGGPANVLTATFGVAQNDNPGTSNGRFTFSTSIDWSPQMLTTDREGRATFGFGLWKSVYLLPVPGPRGVAITQVVPHTFYAGGHPTTMLTDADHAGFDVNVTIDIFAPAPVQAAVVSAVGSWPGARAWDQTAVLQAGSNSVLVAIPASETKAVRLWHPHSHGAQPLYNITVTVAVNPTPAPATPAAAGTVAVVATRRVGFRHVALVTINDTDPATLQAAKAQNGNGDFTMMFRINGAAVYSRGGSVVPMDLLNGRLSAEAHRRMVQSAAEGNMNVLRIWGGGVYHPRAFYDACDEFGVMLYHDLMFTGKAGSVTFSHTVEAEIHHNIKRLSHHPSIIMWDGCNECKPFYRWWQDVIPTVAAVDKSRPVWPASPAGGWSSGVDRLSSRPNGERLTWSSHYRGAGVGGYPWAIENHGPYTGFMRVPNVNNWTMPRALPASVQTVWPSTSLGGGNNPQAVPAYTGPGHEGWAKSEFGANGWPSFEGISVQLPPDQWSMDSPAAKQRNWNVSNLIDAFFGVKAAVAMHEVGDSAFKRQLYQSQIAQMLYLKTMIEGWRSTNVMLSIWWMYNEMWSTGGWGSVDYGSPVPGQLEGGRWRPLHYEMRRSTFNDHMATCNTAGACFVTNDSPFPFQANAEIRLLNVLAGTSTRLALALPDVQGGDGSNISLPAGPKVSQWFCASTGGTQMGQDQDAKSVDQEAPYTHVGGAVPFNATSWNKAVRGSITGCEVACDGLPGCLGFTYGEWHGTDCWLYPASVVTELAASTKAQWYQKPGTKTLPIVPMPPRPPHPPSPPHPPPPHPTPPPPPAPFPEPPQLKCTAWNATSEWAAAGCDAVGSNCVLAITVRTRSGTPQSWSVVPFLPPREMRMAPANVTWQVKSQGGAGVEVEAEVELSSNATAMYVVLTSQAPGRFEDNAVLLEAGKPKAIRFVPWGPLDVALLRTTLRVEHLADDL